MNSQTTTQPERTTKHDTRTSARPQAIVRLVNLHKSFGSLKVLNDISIDFPRGETTVVMGPSGCGKSVMLKHIAGLLRPDFGEVWFEDKRIDTLSESRLGPIRRQIGFLFQQSALFDSMSVADNVAFPLVENTDMKRGRIRERIREVLAMVGLKDKEHQMPASLSGGQRKRIALARAIVLEPKVVLYDEPTTGLDPIRADVINELILKLKRTLNVTSIVVTHDLASAFKVADSIVMLYDGKVLINDQPEAVRKASDDTVQRFLQGKALPEELEGIIDTMPEDESNATRKANEQAEAAHRNKS